MTFKNAEAERALFDTVRGVDSAIRHVDELDDFDLRKALFRQSVGDVEPEYEVDCGGQKLYVSRPFLHHNWRRTVAAWIPKQTDRHEFDRVLFYKSFSHGIWRLLPFYSPNKRGGRRVNKLDEGRPPAEEYASLPIFMQMALSRIESGFTNKKRMFRYWNVRRWTPRHDEARAMTEHVRTREEALKKQRIFTAEQESPVELNAADPRQLPDFDRLEHVFMSQDPFQDDVDSPVTGFRMGFVFRSGDAQRRYLYYLDPMGRTWPAFHEFANSALTRHGLNRKISIAPGELFKPAIDYGPEPDDPEHDAAVSRAEHMGAVVSYAHENRSYSDYTADVHRRPLVAPFRAWLKKNGFRVWDADQIREDLRQNRRR